MGCDIVVWAGGADPCASAEFAEGWERLRAQAGRSAVWHRADAATAGGLLQAALRAGAGAPDSSTVLLLAHAQLLLSNGMLDRLRACLQAGSEMALCFGPGHLPAEAPPDYCTVRGLERYAHAMARAVAPQPVLLQAVPEPTVCRASLTHMGALRALAAGRTLQGCWVPGCFTHDFSAYHQGHEGRQEMVDWIPTDARRVLDVGGGEGHFLQALRAARGCETHLSEFSDAACRLARGRVDHAWPGDFLALHVPCLPGNGVGAFDCIAFLDALEHAADPGAWLDKAHALLRAGGSVVGSVPNVGHWSVVADLLEGRWDYCPVGIHCATHLRFFTRRTLQDLLARHGFGLEKLEASPVPAPAHWKQHWLLTAGLETSAAELDAYAFVFRARKLEPPAP